MITLEELNVLGPSEFVTLIGPVFEGSPWIAQRAWYARPFDDVEDLHRSLCQRMYEADDEERLALIRAHPDLAGRAAREGALTPESTAEQAGAGLDRLNPEEFAALSQMNEEYRVRFGFPFVICVREHTKESILARFSARLENGKDEEVETALAEICKIARLRLRALVEDTTTQDHA